MSLPFLPPMVQLHGAVTHFPIVLLILAAGAEVLSLTLRTRPEAHRLLRQGGLALLALGVVSSGPAILTGYLYGRNLKRAPLEYDLHWKLAVAATIFGALAFIWRLAVRDRLRPATRALCLLLLLGGTFSVGYTGHLGGQMVFGDESEPEPEPVATTATTAVSSATNDRLAQAAAKLDSAAERLDQAGAKLLQGANQQLAGQAAAAAAAARTAAAATPAPAPAPPAIAPPSAADKLLQEQAAARIEKAAARYEAAAAKLEQAAARLKAQPVAGVLVPVPGKTAAPAPTGSAAATPAPTRPGSDPALIAQGKALVVSDEMDCLSCHKLAGKGGRGGPPLDGTGTKYPDPEWQFQHLKDPKKMVPKSRMPDYDWENPDNASLHLTPEKLRAMAAYLSTLK